MKHCTDEDLVGKRTQVQLMKTSLQCVHLPLESIMPLFSIKLTLNAGGDCGLSYFTGNNRDGTYILIHNKEIKNRVNLVRDTIKLVGCKWGLTYISQYACCSVLVLNE